MVYAGFENLWPLPHFGHTPALCAYRRPRLMLRTALAVNDGISNLSDLRDSDRPEYYSFLLRIMTYLHRRGLHNEPNRSLFFFAIII